MYKINSKVDKPDAGYMEMTLNKLMQRGIRLTDCENVKNYYCDLREQLKIDLYNKYGIENPNSPKQITDFIKAMSDRVEMNSRNDIINLCYDDINGKWTSDKTALGKLADMGYEFAQDILDYRHAKKYAESIESIVAFKDYDGLVHPEISLGKTHRVNYSKPALMTIPKKLLWDIIAPYTNGNILYSVDIKNQEPSILINMTGAEELKPALESDKGLYETMFEKCFTPFVTANILVDMLPENRVYSMQELKKIGTISPAYYSATKPLSNNVKYKGKRIVGLETICAGGEKGVHVQLPSTVSIELEDGTVEDVSVTWESDKDYFNKSRDYSLKGYLNDVEVECLKVERKEFKTAWLAISYGQSIMGVDANCKTIDGKHVYRYITKINELKEYRSRIGKAAKAGVNQIGTIFGTPLSVGDVDTDDVRRLNRVLLDLPVQGTGADILALLIKHFYDYIKEHNIEGKLDIYYTRHDELIIEVNKEWYDSTGKVNVENTLRDMLEHQVDDWTPFKVEISQTKSDNMDLIFDDDDE